MSVLSYVRSNLFTLALVLLIAGFSTPQWQSYTVYSSDNERYSGHQGLWHKYLSNDSVSCMGKLYDTDPHVRDRLHTVRNLLAVSIAFSFILLVVCSLKEWLTDEDDDQEWCTNWFVFPSMLAFMLIIFALDLAATVTYDKIYDGTSNIQEGTRHKSGSYVVIVISVVLFILAAVVCDRKPLTIKKTFVCLISIGLFELIRSLYVNRLEHRRRYIVLWLLHLAVLTLFSVGLFSCSWFTVSSVRNANVTVQMGMWFQCRYQDSLTCCSSTTYFYTDIPGWFLTCRDITMLSYVLCLLAIIFSSILVYAPTFRITLLITQICSGVTLVVSCVQYGINVKHEAGVHSRFGAAFVISVVVSTTFLFFILEILIPEESGQNRFDGSMAEPLIPRSNHREEDWTTSDSSLREMFLSLKERMMLLLMHRKSRMGAQIPVNEETEASECHICMMNPLDTRLHPCGHTCCRVCAESLGQCHLCRNHIQARHRFYL